MKRQIFKDSGRNYGNVGILLSMAWLFLSTMFFYMRHEFHLEHEHQVKSNPESEQQAIEIMTLKSEINQLKLQSKSLTQLQKALRIRPSQHAKMLKIIKISSINSETVTDQYEVESAPSNMKFIAQGENFIARVIRKGEKTIVISPSSPASTIPVRIGHNTRTLIFGQSKGIIISDKIPAYQKIKVGDEVRLLPQKTLPGELLIGHVDVITVNEKSRTLTAIIKPVTADLTLGYAQAY